MEAALFQNYSRKKMKNYLHYHLGCECIVTYWYGDEATVKLTIEVLHSYNSVGQGNLQIKRIKPLLYPKSSMTNKQAIELAGLSEYPPHFNDVKVHTNTYEDVIVSWQGNNESREVFNATGELFYCSEQFDWLLKNNFDVFQLIDKGLALDKAKHINQ